jgi:uncharacterized protein YqjF (DUF2071 family)
MPATPEDFDRAIVEDVAHRPWPLPRRPWLMTQTWNDLLFAHWRVDAARLRQLVPAVFDLDVYDGTAWIAVVPFTMTNVGARGLPLLPGVSAFPELNVRTYVRVGDKPGVYFFSLDAGSTVAVHAARTLLNLPYHLADMTAVALPAGATSYRSVRRSNPAARFEANYEPIGPAAPPTPGSLEYFLTERYCLYNVDRRGAPYRLQIHHPSWQLQPARADIVRNAMTSVSGIAIPAAAPLLHFARRQDAVAWGKEKLSPAPR